MADEQIIIGIRGPKGEKMEVLEFNDSTAIVGFDGAEPTSLAFDLEEALERAWQKYKKIPK